MAAILVAITLLGNIFLLWMLLWQGWSGRLQWLTITTALAVLTDVLFHYIHCLAHYLYGPYRLMALYWLFNVLFALCAYEGWKVRMKWLEYLFLIQLSISLVALFAHKHGDSTTVYWIEIFNTWFNVLGILLCIWMLRGECTYEQRT
jgi:hypothetical protein